MPGAGRARYVILEHDHPERHWDLMLEEGGSLRTWRLSAAPEPGRRVTAEASFPHRPSYLDYEGAVSGGRGRVVRWDRGEFAWEVDEERRVVVRLKGGRLDGRLTLTLDAGGAWSASHEPAVGAQGEPR